MQIKDILPETEILALLAEEAAELAQAALKLRPGAGWHQPNASDGARGPEKPGGGMRRRAELPELCAGLAR